MSRLDHPFFVKLYFTFQDDEKLCILCMVSANHGLKPPCVLDERLYCLFLERKGHSTVPVGTETVEAVDSASTWLRLTIMPTVLRCLLINVVLNGLLF